MKRKRIPIAPIKGRLYFAFFMFVITLTMLGGRVYYWKTVKGAEYESRAKEQQINSYDVMVDRKLWYKQIEALLWTETINHLL